LSAAINDVLPPVSNCAGLSGAYRIDHAADLEWIGGYLQ
jgi:hypothetical protein